MSVSDIIAWENGEMTEKEEIKFFQKLIDSGQVWHLQGMYGRRAMELIELGFVTLGSKGHHDYYGNYVPSKTEVQAGTKGSPEYVKKMKKKLEEVL